MNISDKAKAVISSLAPTVATALGGPLAGAAVATLAHALGLDPASAAPSAVNDAIIAAQPETLLKLKQAELDFQARMKELEISEEQLGFADTDSARKREMAVKDWTPSILGLFITAGFFSVLGWMLKFGKPADGGDAMLVMLGSLGTGFATVLSYYFGSSAGSAAKTTALASLAKR